MLPFLFTSTIQEMKLSSKQNPYREHHYRLCVHDNILENICQTIKAHSQTGNWIKLYSKHNLTPKKYMYMYFYP